MQVLLVSIQVKPEHREAFIEATLDDARGSVQDEPGCLRFDVLQDDKDPNRIYLYEVYRDQAAIEAHRQTAHLLKWRETVQDWFTTPIQVQRCATVFPPDQAWHK